MPPKKRKAGTTYTASVDAGTNLCNVDSTTAVDVGQAAGTVHQGDDADMTTWGGAVGSFREEDSPTPDIAVGVVDVGTPPASPMAGVGAVRADDRQEPELPPTPVVEKNDHSPSDGDKEGDDASSDYATDTHPSSPSGDQVSALLQTSCVQGYCI
jgi:hypothetical protein